MSDQDDSPITEEEAAKVAMLAKMGAVVGSQVVDALRNHTRCECLGCQMTVLSTAIQWALQGHDAGRVKVQLEMHIRDMMMVRKDVKDFLAFAEACEKAGVTLSTSDTQGNA